MVRRTEKVEKLRKRGTALVYTCIAYFFINETKYFHCAVQADLLCIIWVNFIL